MDNTSLLAGGDSSCDSRDISRASSIKKDESEAINSPSTSTPANTNRRGIPKRAISTAANKKLTNSMKQLSTPDDDLSAFEKGADSSPTSSSSSKISSAASSTSIQAAPHNVKTEDIEEDENQRPVRAAAAHQAAMSEAANEGKRKKGRPRKLPSEVVKEKNDKIASNIQGLDFLHDKTMKCISGILTFELDLRTSF